ncbi:MAG: hypothetical protein V4501_05585 [Pseudomonadota bacterium]
MANPPATTLQDIVKQFKDTFASIQDWREEKEHTAMIQAVQDWQNAQFEAGKSNAEVLQTIQTFLKNTNRGDATKNAIIAEVQQAAISVCDDPSQKAKLAYEHAEFVARSDTAAVKDYEKINVLYTSARALAQSAIDYSAADKTNEMAMRTIIGDISAKTKAMDDFLDSYKGKFGRWVPIAEEMQIYQKKVDKLFQENFSNEADNSKICEKAYEQINRLMINDGQGSRHAQLIIADKIVEIQHSTTFASAVENSTNLLQLAREFETSGRSEFTQASPKYFKEALSLAEDAAGMSASVPEQGRALALASVAAARLFIVTQDPQEKEQYVAKVADYVMHTTAKDFGELQQFHYADESKMLNLLQNKGLRDAVAHHIAATKKPEEIQELITTNNMVVQWLQKPTSLLGLSRFTGGTDAFQILERATHPAPPVVPLETKVIPEPVKPPVTTSKNPDAPMIAPIRTPQQSFLDDKTLPEIQKALPNWNMSDVQPNAKNADPGAKEMRNGDESFQIQKNAVVTGSQSGDTFEAMLQVIKASDKSAEPKFKIVMNQEDPAVKAGWEQAINKVYGDQGKNIKIVVELPKAEAPAPKPVEPEVEVTQSKGMSRGSSSSK